MGWRDRQGGSEEREDRFTGFDGEVGAFDVSLEMVVGRACEGFVALATRTLGDEDDLLPAAEAEVLFGTGVLLEDLVVLALEDRADDGLAVEGEVTGELVETAVLLGGEADQDLAGLGRIEVGGGGRKDAGARATAAAGRRGHGGRDRGYRRRLGAARAFFPEIELTAERYRGCTKPPCESDRESRKTDICMLQRCGMVLEGRTKDISIRDECVAVRVFGVFCV